MTVLYSDLRNIDQTIYILYRCVNDLYSKEVGEEPFEACCRSGKLICGNGTLFGMKIALYGNDKRDRMNTSFYKRPSIISIHIFSRIPFCTALQILMVLNYSFYIIDLIL